MADLSSLTSKIIDDGNKKASEIEEKNKLEVKAILDKYEKKASAKKEEMILRAKEEGKVKVERILSNSVLKVRNEKLKTKQEIINEIFETAVTRLSSLKDEDFCAFVKNSILNQNIDGDEELVLKEEDKNKINAAFINNVNEELKAKGKIGNITVTYSSNVKAGFLLSKNGIDINNTFQDLVEANRDSLEKDVIDTIFQG
ncbi:MAG: V-type ATP synthase subunit E [Bacillota bacterium]|nr:V-type ATP synthase subunit E [Bacillota bacterium]